MNDEIKEILDGLEKISTPTGISYSGDVTINNDDVKILKDCITNLQEENQRLKKDCQLLYKNGNKDYLELEREYIDYKKQAEKITVVLTKKWQGYKSRIDKTIEIYKHSISIKYKQKRFMEDKTTADLMYEALQGSDK